MENEEGQRALKVFILILPKSEALVKQCSAEKVAFFWDLSNLELQDSGVEKELK